MKTITRFLFSLLLGAIAVGAEAQAPPQDVVTVGTVTATGLVVNVPVSIRDVSGSPLGIDQPAGSRIQSYSIKVDYSPASAVSSVTFTRAGITSSLTPTFESSPSTTGSITLLDAFQESTDLIPFVSNAPAPGNQVAQLTFNLSPTVTPGTTIALALDPTLTQLTDQGGSAATKETTTAGTLGLVNGAIDVPLAAGVPSLSPWILMLLVAALALVAIRLLA